MTLIHFLFICTAVTVIQSKSFIPAEWQPKSRLFNALTRPTGGRIVGGVEASIEERPFQVMIYINGRPLCGGAVISQDTILTASHCFNKLIGPKYQVRLGSTSYIRGGEVVDVKEIIIHPKYDQYNGYYDAAIVKLIKPVVFSTKIQPIRLSNVDTDPSHGQTAIASGWGDLEERGAKYPENLHKVEVPIVDQDVCKVNYTHLGGSQLCAGTSGKDSCQGIVYVSVYKKLFTNLFTFSF